MKNYYLIKAFWTIVLGFPFALLFAQTPGEAWHVSFNGAGQLFDEIRFVRLDAQNNIIVTGRSNSGPSTMLDVVTRKYAPDSSLLWTNTWNNATYNFDDMVQDMVISPNGNIVIVGYSKTTASSQDINSNIFVLVLDNNGNFLWADSIKGTGYTQQGSGAHISRNLGQSVVVDANNNIYVTGQAHGSTNLYDQMVVAKYNATGTQQWVMFRDHSTDFSWTDAGKGVAVDGKGNVYVCGATTLTTTGIDFALWKIDSAGSFAWFKNYPGPVNNTSEGLDDIIADAQGNVYTYGIRSDDKYVIIKYNTTGVKEWNYVFDTIYPSVTASFTGADMNLAFDKDGNIVFAANMNSRIGVAKLTPAGTLAWIKLHGGTGQYNNELYGIHVDDGNNIYISGAYNNASSSFYDVGVAKFNASGNLLWSVTYNGASSNNDKGHSIAVAPDGSVYVGGLSESNYFLIKYADEPVGIGEVNTGILSLHIYPNPAKTFLSVITDVTLSNNAYTIYDNTGKQVAAGKLQGTKTDIDIATLHTGAYYIQCGAIKRAFVKAD